MKRGIKADKVQYLDRKNGLFAEFDFNLIADETRFPFRLQCPQSTYTYLLYERLQKRSNVEMHFQAEVLGFTQDQEGVTVSVQIPEGLQQFRTPFLLGADGARSTVRKTLGMKFDGYTLPERFLLVVPLSISRNTFRTSPM
jgi:3-(3-hydroxy-phenyl)propionate hydroxylase